MGNQSSSPAAAVLLGTVLLRAADKSADVNFVDSINGNNTWFEVVMEDGTLVQVTIEASKP